MQFRDAIGVYASQLRCLSVPNPSSVLAKRPFNRDEVIARYKRLIRSLPRANQYLLLYVLDLLSVFARKSERNLMTAKSNALPQPQKSRKLIFHQIWP